MLSFLLPYHLERSHPVALRDGFALKMDVYRLRAPPPERRPVVILLRTPYGRIAMLPVVRLLSSLECHVCVSNVRYNESHLAMLDASKYEKQDGSDTVEHVRETFGHNCRVFMLGWSYLGYTAMAAANGLADDGRRPLAGIVSVCTDSTALSAIETNGVVCHEFLTQWITYVETYRYLQQRRWMRLGVCSCMSSVTDASEVYTMTDLHQREHSYRRDLTRDRASLQYVQTPFYFIGGWFDIMVEGTINDYLSALAAYHSSPDHAHMRPKLTIGPWNHMRVLYQGSKQSAWRLCVEWMKQQMSRMTTPLTGEHALPPTRRAVDNPTVPSDQECLEGTQHSDDVHVYIPTLPWRSVREYFLSYLSAWKTLVFPTEELPGAWHSFSVWPPRTQSQTLYMCPHHLLSCNVPTHDHVYKYQYMASNRTPSANNSSISMRCVYKRVDNTLERRRDLVVLTTHRLQEPVHVLGKITVCLHLSSNAVGCLPIVFRVCDVTPDGLSTAIHETIVPVNVAPGCRLMSQTFESDTVAHTFQDGHSMRIHICSDAFPHWDVSTMLQSSQFHVEVHTRSSQPCTVVVPCFQSNVMPCAPT